MQPFTFNDKIIMAAVPLKVILETTVPVPVHGNLYKMYCL